MALLKLMTCSFQVLRWQKWFCWDMKLVKLEVSWSSCSSLRNRSKGHKLNISKTWRKRGLIWSLLHLFFIHFPLTNHCWMRKSERHCPVRGPNFSDLSLSLSPQIWAGDLKVLFSSSVALEFLLEPWKSTYFHFGIFQKKSPTPITLGFSEARWLGRLRNCIACCEGAARLCATGDALSKMTWPPGAFFAFENGLRIFFGENAFLKMAGIWVVCTNTNWCCSFSQFECETS